MMPEIAVAPTPAAQGTRWTATPKQDVAVQSDVCTLFEGDYHIGVCALINSLVSQGFSGTIWAGYRGSLPPWTASLKVAGPNSYSVNDAVKINFIEVTSHVHLTNYKPQFMLSLFETTTAPVLWYFDPDITIFSPWSFFRSWAAYGIALCQEVVNGTMPDDHPIRMMWNDFASSLNLHSPRKIGRYFNAGFVGVSRANVSFLKTWSDLLQAAHACGADAKSISMRDRTYPFHALDQDLMNVAAMYTTCELSTIGPEGMGFVPGGFTMYHSAGAVKPWRKRMIASALLGIPPSDADKHFLLSLNGPLKPYSKSSVRLKSFSGKVGALIGRFYHRN
jgi:hypothetical protein